MEAIFTLLLLLLHDILIDPSKDIFFFQIYGSNTSLNKARQMFISNMEGNLYVVF